MGGLETIALQVILSHPEYHARPECLAEPIWQAQRYGSAPDNERYLECLERWQGKA